MLNIKDLNRQEKVFFAGCVKSMILADGVIDDVEIAEVNKIRDILHFDDIDSCLDEFEEEVDSEDAFWEMALEVDREEARDLILGTLDELSRVSGYQHLPEKTLYNNLKEVWGRG